MKANHKPRLLDLFCGAGGAAMGYHRAGFEIVGVDIEPQSDFPFEFHQADAMTFSLDGFDAIHASPPCQTFSEMQKIHKNQAEHPNLVAPTRERLGQRLYVIENVVGAPLIDPILLCGTFFGLRIVRHRLFEANWPLSAPTIDCNHSNIYDPWHGGPGGRSANQFRAAMGIDWMHDAGGGKRRGTLSQAIPPAYTEWTGAQFMAHLRTVV